MRWIAVATIATFSVLVVLGGPESPYDACRRLGLKRLARQLSTRANPADVALAWARQPSNRNPEVRQEAIESWQGLESG